MKKRRSESQSPTFYTQETFAKKPFKIIETLSSGPSALRSLLRAQWSTNTELKFGECCSFAKRIAQTEGKPEKRDNLLDGAHASGSTRALCETTGKAF